MPDKHTLIEAPFKTFVHNVEVIKTWLADSNFEFDNAKALLKCFISLYIHQVGYATRTYSSEKQALHFELPAFLAQEEVAFPIIELSKADIRTRKLTEEELDVLSRFFSVHFTKHVRGCLFLAKEEEMYFRACVSLLHLAAKADDFKYTFSEWVLSSPLENSELVYLFSLSFFDPFLNSKAISIENRQIQANRSSKIAYLKPFYSFLLEQPNVFYKMLAMSNHYIENALQQENAFDSLPFQALNLCRHLLILSSIEESVLLNHSLENTEWQDLLHVFSLNAIKLTHKRIEGDGFFQSSEFNHLNSYYVPFFKQLNRDSVLCEVLYLTPLLNQEHIFMPDYFDLIKAIKKNWNISEEMIERFFNYLQKCIESHLIQFQSLVPATPPLKFEMHLDLIGELSRMILYTLNYDFGDNQFFIKKLGEFSLSIMNESHAQFLLILEQFKQFDQNEANEYLKQSYNHIFALENIPLKSDILERCLSEFYAAKN